MNKQKSKIQILMKQAVQLGLLPMLWLLLFTLPLCVKADTPTLTKGKLPVPGTSSYSNYLTLSQNGQLLKVDSWTLNWESDGNLALYFCDQELLWSSNTGSKGNILVFQEDDGQLAVKDNSGKIIWTSGSGGEILEILFGGNMVLTGTGGKVIWQTNTALIPDFPVSTWPNTEHAKKAVQDYLIPLNPGYKYLSLTLQGGDGGKRVVKEAWGDVRFEVEAGCGATIKAVFEIGNGAKQIPGGSVIRFMVGSAGRTVTNQAEYGSPGGAATGVFIKRYQSAKWNLLAVAGGGGGAFANCCTKKHPGKEATIYEGGSQGAGNGGVGGTGGWTGETREVAGPGFGSPGDGVFTAYIYAPFENNQTDGGWYNGNVDPTIVPHGKYGYQDGSWGLAGGGGAGTGGGGGGGYSGGGNGGMWYGGGGGGCYINTGMAIYGTRTANGTTTDTKDGFVTYQFTNESPVASIKFAANTTKCAVVKNANASGSTNVELASCQDGSTQKWILGNSQIMLSANVYKCLEIEQNLTANGTNVQLYNCNASPGEGWIYDVYRKIIRSGNDFNKCIDLVNGITTSGTNIQLYDCVSDEHQVNQQWVIDGVPSKMPSGSNRRIYLEKDHNKCVDINAAGTANGTNVQLYHCHNGNSQYMVFDNRYIRMQANTGKCLSLQDAGDGNGNNIHLWDCKGKDNQKWVYDGIAKAFRSVVNIHKCLSVEGSSDDNAQDGANIHLWDCKSNENQRFVLD